MDKFLLCTMVKLENRYLGEWITHHLNIGFDKIVIIDNNDTIGENAENIYEVDEIKHGVKEKLIDIFPLNNGKHLQQIYFAEVFHKYKCDYNWFMFLDADEFLILKNHTSIKDYINQDKFKQYNAIRFNWKCYGDCGLITASNYSIKRFTKHVQSNQDKLCKTLFKYVDDELIFPNSHGPLSLNINTCNTKGVSVLPQSPKCTMCHEDAWINHYTTKTIEEYLTLKIKRGGSAQSLNTLQDKYNLNYFWMFNECTPEHKKYIAQFALQHNLHELINGLNFNTLYIKTTCDENLDYDYIEFDKNLDCCLNDNLRMHGNYTLHYKNGGVIKNINYSIIELCKKYDFIIVPKTWSNLQKIYNIINYGE